jgi:hypothetical protein
MRDFRSGRVASAAKGAVALFRDGDWLTAARANAYVLILSWLTAAAMLAWVALSRGGLDPTGKPLGTDFMSFWTASKLALGGAPWSPYDVAAHHAQQTRLFGHDVGYAAFFYPPIFLLICLPLALLPYLVSLSVWLAATGVAYFRVVRTWLGKEFGAAPVLAFPAVMITVGHGQNAFLSAALFGAGARWLDRRPWLAGVMFGCLAYKPHLGLVIPVALLAARRWRTFAAAALSVATLAGLSLAVFGAETWRAFIADSAVSRAALEQGLVGDAKMQSAFAAVRLLGGDLTLAYGAQIAAMAMAGGAVVWLQRRAFRAAAEGPALVAASLLATPFLLDYDLLLLAIPLAWMFREGVRSGFLPWEKTLLAAAFALPAVSRTLAADVRLPLAPLVVGALLIAILRRASVFEAAKTALPATSGSLNGELRAAA